MDPFRHLSRGRSTDDTSPGWGGKGSAEEREMSRKNKRKPPVRTGHDDRAKERQGSAPTAPRPAAPKGSEPSAPDGLSGNWS